MKLDFLTVLITVVSLVLLMIPGFLLKKTKLFSNTAESALSALCLYGCQPLLMFMSFQKTSFTPEIAINMLIVAGLTLLVHAVMIGLMFLIFRNKKESTKAKINCMRFASVFSNCGYMGLPFLQMLFTPFGDAIAGQILIYGGVVIGMFNILNWSIGVFMMTGDIKSMSAKRAFLNPTVLGLFIGLIVFFIAQTPLASICPDGTLGDQILTKLMDSCGFLANMVTPLSMIVIGVKLASVNLKELFIDVWAYVTCFNKLILMSLITILIVAFLPIEPLIKYTVFFSLSMPAATGTVMFAVQFGGDSKSGSVFVLLSTILSILTIPLMFMLFGVIVPMP